MPSSRESLIDLPVVKISQFQHIMDGIPLDNVLNNPLVVTVREACKEWGFFRVVNHGISEDLLPKVDSVSRQLLSVPTGVKDGGYSYVMLPNSDSVKEISEKVWPGGNSDACETIETYTTCLSDLAQKIAKIILLSLGLDANKFHESGFPRYTTSLRINHYTSDGKPAGNEALGSHTDINAFTILYQDEAGGLEIRSKQGNWISVKPYPHSFIINIGDCVKAWSNGQYRSAEHRVVRNGWTDRMSIACFLSFTEEKEIWAPAELVDSENPRRYKPFLYSQFRSEFLNLAKEKKEKNESFVSFIDRFAGV